MTSDHERRRQLSTFRPLITVVANGDTYWLIDAKDGKWLHHTPIPTLEYAIDIAREYNGTDSMADAVVRSLHIDTRREFKKIWILGPLEYLALRRRWGGFRKRQTAIAGTIGDEITVGWFSWWRYQWE